MPYRPILTPQPPTEAEIESPQIMEAAAFVESGEEHLAMLADLARYGMELAQAQRDYAKSRLAKVTAEGSALNPGEDPGVAFSKTAQTVRRTIAMRRELKNEVDKRRAGLIGDRAARRAKRAADHVSAVKDAIEITLSHAYHADLILPDFDPAADPYKPEPYEIERREMFDDVERLLEDFDEYGDWLNRPIGETVAKLCVALGLKPDICVKRGDTWLVRRRNTPHETKQQDKRGSRPVPAAAACSP
jgi:hypothetical protein